MKLIWNTFHLQLIAMQYEMSCFSNNCAGQYRLKLASSLKPLH